ncbi:hypothetical protein NPIL_101891 [Nephila pilipes]|uniref:Uncharacterized protein n=1 Tax=Nephila pilipes TaxID=299642 RepID=A0A8X6NCR0_NEPPI|nr:hypothetical protein NPIL_101891 [Nephila pilipes]
MFTAHREGRYDHFKDGCSSVENNASSCRSLIFKNEIMSDQVKMLVMQVHRTTIRKLGDEASINIGSVHAILTGDLVIRIISGGPLIKSSLVKSSIPVLSDSLLSRHGSTGLLEFPQTENNLKGSLCQSSKV